MQYYIKEIFKPFNFTIMKVEVITTFSAIATCLATFSQNYLGISGVFALVLLILLATDFITGIAVSKYNKEPITSRKGLRTVYKAGAYMLFIFVAFNLHNELKEKAGLFEDVIKYFHIYIIIHISFWELFSVDENLKKLGLDLGITTLLKSFYSSIKNIFNKIGPADKEQPIDIDLKKDEDI